MKLAIESGYPKNAPAIKLYADMAATIPSSGVEKNSKSLEEISPNSKLPTKMNTKPKNLLIFLRVPATV